MIGLSKRHTVYPWLLGLSVLACECRGEQPKSSIATRVIKEKQQPVEPAISHSEFLTLKPISPISTASTNTLPQPILGGINTTWFPNVGLVTSYNSRGAASAGTGTLVAATWMLTAAHMMSVSGGLTAVSFDVGGTRYWASGVAVHPSFGRINANGMPYGDIALVRLSHAVPANIKPALIQIIPPRIGDNLTIVGFGNTGNGFIGQINNTMGKRYGSIKVDAVSTDWIIWRFDFGERWSTTHGDSGGPTLNSQGWIVAVTSGGNAKGFGGSGTGYGDLCWNTRCDIHFSWMRSIVARYGSSAHIPVGIQYIAKPENAAKDLLSLVSGIPSTTVTPKPLISALSLE